MFEHRLYNSEHHTTARKQPYKVSGICHKTKLNLKQTLPRFVLNTSLLCLSAMKMQNVFKTHFSVLHMKLHCNIVCALSYDIVTLLLVLAPWCMDRVRKDSDQGIQSQLSDSDQGKYV